MADDSFLAPLPQTTFQDKPTSRWRLSIDQWLPDKLKALDDQDVALRARTFVILNLLCIVPLVPLFLLLLSCIFIGVEGLAWPTFILAVVIVAQVVCGYYFQRTADLVKASFAYAITIFILMVAVVLLTGGWHSPTTVFLLTLPVIIGLIVGRLVGAFFALLVLSFFTYLLYLLESGFTFVQLLPESILLYSNTGMWALTVFAILGCLLLYEYSTQNLSRAIGADKKQLEHSARYDVLTQLFNEQALFEELKILCAEVDEIKAVKAVKGHGSQDFALLYLKVNNLTDVVSRFGFEVGDLFVQSLAKTLQQTLPSEGEHYVLGRYSVDSFMVLLKVVDDYGAFISDINRFKNLNQKMLNLDQNLQLKVELNVGGAVVADRDIMGEAVSIEKLIDTAKNNCKEAGNLYVHLA